MTHDEKIVEAASRAYCKVIGLAYDCLSPALAAKRDEAMRAAITAFQAEAWQDISTAKHGERILVWNAMAGAYTSELVHGQWPLRLWDGVTGNWFPVPTHWQPLPPAPKATPDRSEQ